MLATRKNIKKLESISEEKSKELELVTEQKDKMNAELLVAKEIQQSMLPKLCSLKSAAKKIELCASMQPAREVGGDWYDYFVIGKTKLALIIADVSGNGIPAALYMVVAKTLMKNLATEGLTCKSICKKVNESLCENNKNNMFATAFVSILDLTTSELTYVNVGHNPPLLNRNGKSIWLNKRSGFPLGAFMGSKYKSHTIHLKKSDIMMMYTDGFTEAQDENNGFYTKERLERIFLSAASHAPLSDLEMKIKNDVALFCGKACPSDDRALMLLRVL